MQCCREVSEEFKALRQTTRGCPEFRLSHLHLRHPLLLSPEWAGRTVAASQVPGWPNYRPKSNRSPSLTLIQGPQTLSSRWEGVQRRSGGLCVPVFWSRGSGRHPQLPSHFKPPVYGHSMCGPHGYLVTWTHCFVSPSPTRLCEHQWDH